MLPPPVLSIRGTQACEHKNAPSRWVDITCRHSANAVSPIDLNTATPALLTNALMRSKAASTWLTALLTCRGSDTSQCAVMTWPGWFSRAAVRARVSRSTSWIANRSPCAKNHWPRARPMPRVLRVMTAAGSATDPLHNLPRSVISGARAVCCVVFLLNSPLLTAKRRLAAHRDSLDKSSPELCRRSLNLSMSEKLRKG